MAKQTAASKYKAAIEQIVEKLDTAAGESGIEAALAIANEVLGRHPAAKAPPEFENLGSLITIKGDGNRCLGFLMDFGPGRGVFDPDLGAVAVSSEHALAHNLALDKAMLDGLDSACEIGMGGWFYLRGDNPTWATTFIGTTVGPVSLIGKSRKYRLIRGCMVLHGTMQKDSDAVYFERVV